MEVVDVDEDESIRSKDGSVMDGFENIELAKCA
jgi:hypothetical protein